MSKHRNKGSFRQSPDELAVRLAHGPRSVVAAQPLPGKRKAQKPARACRAYQLNQALFERSSG